MIRTLIRVDGGSVSEVQCSQSARVLVMDEDDGECSWVGDSAELKEEDWEQGLAEVVEMDELRRGK